MIEIRRATVDDASAIQRIYAPFVEFTHVSFEEIPPDVAEIEKRIKEGSVKFPWLVAEQNGQVVGYAYASAHRVRASYRWSVDTAIYLDAAFRGQGIGKTLYSRLLETLRSQGFFNAFAGVTLPNRGSIALHESLGFKPIALYENVGYKLGAWHSVRWLCLPLQEPADEVEEPIPFNEMP
jgi:phosphinothricin acetyltransferase